MQAFRLKLVREIANNVFLPIVPPSVAGDHGENDWAPPSDRLRLEAKPVNT
jgi:hypothetical protein